MAFDYRIARGRWPSRPNADPGVHSLGQWLADQRRAARAGTLRPARLAYLTDMLPGWTDDGSEHRDRGWMRLASALSEFRARTGAWPDRRSRDTDEASLGDWHNVQRRLASTDAKRMTPARRAHLDAVAPGWNDPRPPRPAPLAPGWARRS